MLHCKECHQDFFDLDKHKFNCTPRDTLCRVCNPKSKELLVLEEEIHKTSAERGSMEGIEGVFGDGPWNKGFVDKYVNTGKGIETKLFGCSQLYKGKIRSDMIDAGVPLKAALMGIVQFALENKLVLVLISPFIFLFWKRLLKSAVYWFSMIYMKDLKQKTLTNIEQFSPVTKELIRAGFKLAERIPTKSDISFPYEGIWHEGEKDDNEYQVRVRRCIWAIATFIQADSAYYWRVQDGLNCIKERTVKGLLNAFNLVLQREKQIKGKVKQLYTLLRLIMLFPPIRKFAIIYLRELNFTRFEPDEDDRYFAYRRSCYDFDGKGWDERMAWAREIDKRDGNVIIGS